MSIFIASHQKFFANRFFVCHSTTTTLSFFFISIFSNCVLVSGKHALKLCICRFKNQRTRLKISYEETRDAQMISCKDILLIVNYVHVFRCLLDTICNLRVAKICSIDLRNTLFSHSHSFLPFQGIFKIFNFLRYECPDMGICIIDFDKKLESDASQGVRGMGACVPIRGVSWMV